MGQALSKRSMVNQLLLRKGGLISKDMEPQNGWLSQKGHTPGCHLALSFCESGGLWKEGHMVSQLPQNCLKANIQWKGRVPMTLFLGTPCWLAVRGNPKEFPLPQFSGYYFLAGLSSKTHTISPLDVSKFMQVCLWHLLPCSMCARYTLRLPGPRAPKALLITRRFILGKPVASPASTPWIDPTGAIQGPTARGPSPAFWRFARASASGEQASCATPKENAPKPLRTYRSAARTHTYVYIYIYNPFLGGGRMGGYSCRCRAGFGGGPLRQTVNRGGGSRFGDTGVGTHPTFRKLPSGHRTHISDLGDAWSSGARQSALQGLSCCSASG